MFGFIFPEDSWNISLWYKNSSATKCTGDIFAVKECFEIEFFECKTIHTISELLLKIFVYFAKFEGSRVRSIGEFQTWKLLFMQGVSKLKQTKSPRGKRS